eukprot:scaffold180063_cov18-Prasinocladus_malaysianus.AAC.1
MAENHSAQVIITLMVSTDCKNNDTATDAQPNAPEFPMGAVCTSKVRAWRRTREQDDLHAEAVDLAGAVQGGRGRDRIQAPHTAADRRHRQRMLAPAEDGKGRGLGGRQIGNGQKKKVVTMSPLRLESAVFCRELQPGGLIDARARADGVASYMLGRFVDDTIRRPPRYPCWGVEPTTYGLKGIRLNQLS